MFGIFKKNFGTQCLLFSSKDLNNEVAKIQNLKILSLMQVQFLSLKYL